MGSAERGGADSEEAPSLLCRKSVLIGMLTSGFVVAETSQSSASAAGTTKPRQITATPPTYISKWSPATPYVRGQQVTSPNNDVVSANVTHTSTDSYGTDTPKWTLSSTFASNATETTVAAGRLSETSLTATYAKWAPAPLGGTKDDLASLFAAQSALGTGTLRLQTGTYRLSGRLNVASGVNLVGTASGKTTPGTRIVCTTAGSGLSFGARGVENRGGRTGNFTLDADNIATNPLYLGRVVQRSFESIDVINARGTGVVIEEAQNNVIISLSIEDCHGGGLQLDYGCGGNLFVRTEINASGADGGYALLSTQSGFPDPAVYPVPTHNTFLHSIFERIPNGAAGLVKQTAGDALTLDTAVLASGPSPASSNILLDVANGNINIRSPRYFGDDLAAVITAVRVAQGATLNELGVAYLTNLLCAYNVVTGSTINQELAPLIGNTQHIYSGSDGTSETAIRTRLRHPLEITRGTTADTYSMCNLRGESGMRYRQLGDGKLEWMDGTSYVGDTNLYRSGAGTLATDALFRCKTSTPSRRPTAAAAGVGASYYDSTLQKPIWSDGTIWRDAGGNVA